jgi:DnaJ family protein C protein 11
MAKATEELHEDFWGNQEQDYYALLGVRRDASLEQIRSRYMALSREFHPDRNRNRDPALTALAKTQYPILDRAYKVLSDPIRRQAYDAYGEMVSLLLVSCI